MIPAFTWTLVRSGSEVRLVLVESTLIRLDADPGGSPWVKWGYRSHPDRAREKAVKETESLEAWGFVLKVHVVMRKTDISPDALYDESESGRKIGPLLTSLFDGPWLAL